MNAPTPNALTDQLTDIITSNRVDLTLPLDETGLPHAGPAGHIGVAHLRYQPGPDGSAYGSDVLLTDARPGWPSPQPDTIDLLRQRGSGTGDTGGGHDAAAAAGDSV